MKIRTLLFSLLLLAIPSASFADEIADSDREMIREMQEKPEITHENTIKAQDEVLDQENERETNKPAERRQQ